MGNGLTQELLVADVGATHVRLSVATPVGDLSRPRKFKGAQFPDLSAVIREYAHGTGAALPRDACIAVAAPICGDRIEFTNNPWSFSVAGLRRALSLDNLLIVNDFEALARSLPSLPESSLFRMGRGVIGADANKAVIGPGSGLGIAGLTPTACGWRPIVGEGGYIDLAPGTDYEQSVWECIFRRHGRVSAERVLSGPGLQELFRAVAEVNDLPMEPPFHREGKDSSAHQPADILRLGLAGECNTCRDSLDLFCAFLGDVAGNVALTFGARGGVYLGGGILPRMLPLLENSRFRSRFESKGRMSDYMKDIATVVITAELPALAGCISAFNEYRNP